MAKAKKRVRVDGKALKIVEAISADDNDELNSRRFARLCGMLRSAEIARSVLSEYGKDCVVKEAQDRLNGKIPARA